MRVPLPWLREYCDPPLDVGQIEERLTMTGTKVEAIHHHGVASTENFVVGRALSAGQTVAVATPGAVMPDGTKLKRAKLRGVVSEGMILSESELDLGSGGEGIMVLETLDAEFAPGTPLADVLPISM